jgi:hypothetical protein
MEPNDTTVIGPHFGAKNMKNTTAGIICIFILNPKIIKYGKLIALFSIFYEVTMHGTMVFPRDRSLAHYSSSYM